jgi:hypothetical protein
MSTGNRKRPSPAFVVGMVALLAVLASSATALPGKNGVDKNDLAKNVVKAKNIKKNAVNAKHIKDGQVGAGELADPEAFHVVGAPGEPAFSTGGEGDCLWQNPPAAILPDVNPASFFKDADGIVHLAGTPAAFDGPGGDAACGGPDGSDLLIFQLPAGYQPDHLEIFPSGNSSIGANIIAPDSGLTLGTTVLPPGAVVVASITDGNATTLDGFTFRAAGPAGPGSSPTKTPRLSLKDLRDLLS